MDLTISNPAGAGAGTRFRVKLFSKYRTIRGTLDETITVSAAIKRQYSSVLPLLRYR